MTDTQIPIPTVANSAANRMVRKIAHIRESAASIKLPYTHRAKEGTKSRGKPPSNAKLADRITSDVTSALNAWALIVQANGTILKAAKHAEWKMESLLGDDAKHDSDLSELKSAIATLEEVMT